MRAEVLQIFDIKGHSFITSTIRGRGSHKILISCAEGCGQFSGRCVCGVGECCRTKLDGCVFGGWRRESEFSNFNW